MFDSIQRNSRSSLILKDCVSPGKSDPRTHTKQVVLFVRFGVISWIRSYPSGKETPTKLRHLPNSPTISNSRYIAAPTHPDKRAIVATLALLRDPA